MRTANKFAGLYFLVAPVVLVNNAHTNGRQASPVGRAVEGAA